MAVSPMTIRWNTRTAGDGWIAMLLFDPQFSYLTLRMLLSNSPRCGAWRLSECLTRHASFWLMTLTVHLQIWPRTTSMRGSSEGEQLLDHGLTQPFKSIYLVKAVSYT